MTKLINHFLGRPNGHRTYVNQFPVWELNILTAAVWTWPFPRFSSFCLSSAYLKQKIDQFSNKHGPAHYCKLMNLAAHLLMLCRWWWCCTPPLSCPLPFVAKKNWIDNPKINFLIKLLIANRGLTWLFNLTGVDIPVMRVWVNRSHVRAPVYRI